MATYLGNDGEVKIGTDTVLEVTDFTLDTSVNTADDSALGDDWDTHQIGSKSWSGSVSCWLDPDDTTGQEVTVEGASVDLHLIPQGTGTGNRDFNGTATITGVSHNVSRNTTSTVSFSFTGNGALTRDDLA